jgi:hypothetical protein
MPRLVVVLDLDQTLIHSIPIHEAQGTKAARLKQYAKEAGKHHRKATMPGQYVVYARPGLEEFLEAVMARCDVVIFTMASLGYAWWVIRTYILAGKPAERRKRILAVLTEPQCAQSQAHAKAKGLPRGREAASSPKWLSYLFDTHPELGLDKKYTVFLDDLTSVQKANPEHAIYTPPFDVLKPGAGEDRYLWNVQGELVKRLRAAR